MRILRIVHRLYPPTVGGLSFHADLLSTEQAKAGHEVVVLTTQEGAIPDMSVGMVTRFGDSNPSLDH